MTSKSMRDICHFFSAIPKNWGIGITKKFDDNTQELWQRQPRKAHSCDKPFEEKNQGELDTQYPVSMARDTF